MIALLATAALLAPGCASARGFGGGGGGFHGGGGFGGFHGGGGFGGWHGGGGGWHGGSVAAFRGAPMGGNVAFHHVGMVGGPHFVPGFRPGFRRHVFIGGVGFVGGYYYGDDYPYYGYADQGYPDQVYPDQGYYEGGYVDTGCALVRQRVLTPYGWTIRTVQLCQ
jgi:hypothetical protein